MSSSQNSLNLLESFILNGKSFRYLDALEGNIDPDGKSDFEVETITFIKNWLSGQERFQIKTSGSTGNPKIINITKEQIQKSALRTIVTFNLKPGQAILACLNTTFIAGMMMLARAIEGNLKLIIESPRANPFAHIEYGKSIHFCALTPYQAETILEDTPAKLDQIKTILIGGTALNPILEERFQNIKAKVFQSYAMTETLTHVALRKVNGKEKSDIYHALQGVSFSQDTRKCLIIHDRILGIEHLITNDVVELVGKKSFRWIGRYDNVINSGGIKIHIEGVENEIHGIFDDMQIQNTFCLLSIPDRKFTNKMILLIEQNESLINEDIILATLKRKLPKYHDPKSVKQVSELILTKSGKIDRKRNTELYLST